MNIDTLRIIAVVLGALAFLGVCWWAFSPSRRKRFEEDARLPFADEEESGRSAQSADRESDKASKEESGSTGQKGGSSARQNGPSAGSDSAGAEKKGQDKQ